MKTGCFGWIKADSCTLQNIVNVLEPSENLLSANAIAEDKREVKCI